MRHAGVEFLLGDVDILNLDVEILPCREAVALGLDVGIADAHAEVVDRLLVAEGGHNLVNLFRIEAHLLQAVGVLVFLAELRGIHQNHGVVVGLVGTLVEKQHRHIGARVGKHIGRHAHHAAHHMVVDDAGQNLVLHPTLCRDEARGNHDGALAVGRYGVDDMLDEAGVDGHRLLLLGGD